MKYSLSPGLRTIVRVLILVLMWPLNTWGQSDSDGASRSTEDTGYVARAQFTSAVENREPMDLLEFISTDSDRLYFFTDIRGMEGKTITHRWRFFGDVVTDIDFVVKGPRWRVFSYKTLEKSLAGEWSVEIIDDESKVYSEHSILVAKPTEDTRMPSPGTDDSSKTNVNVTTNSTPLEMPANVVRVKSVFPDAEYLLINDSLGSVACPSSGRFRWSEKSANVWVLEMGEHSFIRVHESKNDIVDLKPDPAYALADPQCLAYLGNRFSAEHNELVVEIQADCAGTENDIFYARTLTRRDETIDLTIYDDQYTVCRYTLN